jgi:hypothetical protein
VRPLAACRLAMQQQRRASGMQARQCCCNGAAVCQGATLRLHRLVAPCCVQPALTWASAQQQLPAAVVSSGVPLTLAR